MEAVSISEETDRTENSRSVTTDDLNTGNASMYAGWNLKHSASCIPVVSNASCKLKLEKAVNHQQSY